MKTKSLHLNPVLTKEKIRIFTLSLIMALFAVVSVKAQTNTVVDIIVNSDDHHTLETAVLAAGLETALSGTGPFTVFAPTDAAFAALGQETIDALLADPHGALSTILQYHVASGDVRAGDLSDGQIVEMFEGTDAFISLFDMKAYINQAEITVTDQVASNGVVHVIDAVITQPKSIVDIVVNSPRHETLETAVVEAQLAGALSAPGTFTLFAPTDAAFAALGDAVGELLLDPTGELAEILKYHVVGATALSGSLSDGDTFTTLEGSDIDVTINGDGVFINDAKVVFADYEAPNGVVHVIDAVLTPPTTVVDIIVDSDVHTNLAAAVSAAQLVDALSGDGPFTVFAPTDDAFAALGQETIDALFADATGALADILKYHVVSGNVKAGDLSDGQIVEMFEGTDAFVSLFDSKAYINQAMITMTDIEADNGVVHVIDAVITQPKSIVDIVVNSPRHETLETAVVEAQLAGALSAPGTFTLFAPTDAAFAALGDAVGELLLDPTGYLAEILKYHVVGATALSSGLSDGDTFETLKGYDINVSITDGNVFINDAQVIFADYEAPNGVVHVIDAVMLPPADVQISENQDYGTIITDANGNSLYFFTLDADGSSLCVDGCLDNWPVFYQPSAAAGTGLDAADFGSIDRGNGVMQTTYKGWPLYYFANDNAPGETNGEGVIGKWFLAKPDYSIMIVDNQLVGNDGKNYKSDYTEGDEVTQYFTDAEGNTLYTWINDRYNKNNFTAADLSNNGVWPVFEEDGMIFPSTLDSSAFATIDVFGKTQLTYKGWPLYYFGQDAARGETKGVSVPTPGVWPVATADMMEAGYATVVDIIVNSEVHTILETAVIEAELADDLSADGPFTVFAPTDDAFTALGQATIDALLDDPTGDLAQILLYHVVPGKTLSGDLTDGMVITTLNGDSITVSIMDSKVYIDDAMVTIANLEADNGVVHVIDAVLTPSSTVVDIIVGSADHNSLEAAVIAAGLADALSADGPFTVFAPTDAAFAALGQETIDALFEDATGALSDILKYHVVNGSVMAGDLSDGQIVEMFEGTDAFVSLFDSKAYINQAMITVTNLEADNGVVHVIDAVITQPTSIVDIVVNSPRHETLETAVTQAQLAGALSAPGTFTLFAPTDAAFAALGQETLDALLSDPTGQLADILKYHVVGATALSANLSDGDTFTTLQGSDITVTINNDGIFIDDAKVIFADYEAPNGVVHVIDAVIQPEITSIEEKMSIFSNAVVYPNPATDRINFRFEMSTTSDVSIDVYDMVGQKISQRDLGVLPAGTNDFVMGTEAMENGIYIIIVNSGESTFANKVRVIR